MTICPRCRYERKKGDEIISEAECPRCGIIYSKWQPSEITEKSEIKKIDKIESDWREPAGSAKSERKIIYYALVIVLAIIISSVTIPYLISQFQEKRNDIPGGHIKDTLIDPRKVNNANELPQIKPAESNRINVPQLEDEKPSLSDIFKRNRHSVVVVKTARGVGSGFFINTQGYIVTNKHVLTDAGNAEIKTLTGNSYKINRIVAEDQDADLVIASTEAPVSESLPVNLKSRLPEVGEKIIVIGNPLGLEQTVSDGIVSAVRRSQQAINYVQITAPVSPGNSGGPVLDMRGEVIGVASFQYRQGQNLNFCVASERVIGLKNGTVQASTQATPGSFQVPQQRDVYCYADSQGAVHFVDWNAGMKLNRPDGSLDREKFDKWALDQVGGNPFIIDPEREAKSALESNKEQVFKNVFPNKSMSDNNLTVSERTWLDRNYNRFYVETYNKIISRRSEAIMKYKYMLYEFDKFNHNRR